jgi:DNA-binding NtrC family response regulator
MNVRELENVLQRALVLHENGCITKSDILTDILSTTMQSRVDQDTRLSEVG